MKSTGPCVEPQNVRLKMRFYKDFHNFNNLRIKFLYICKVQYIIFFHNKRTCVCLLVLVMHLFDDFGVEHLKVHLKLFNIKLERTEIIQD